MTGKRPVENDRKNTRIYITSRVVIRDGLESFILHLSGNEFIELSLYVDVF